MAEIRVALLGFGNVGRSFARAVSQSAPGIRIAAAADSSGGLLLSGPEDLERALAAKQSNQPLAALGAADPSSFVDTVARAGIALLVEALASGLADGQPGLDLVRAALRKGIDVVTVDKAPLVRGLDLLDGDSRGSGALLRASGTTGVAPPPELARGTVLEIRGVLNGTTNAILTSMQDGALRFEEALVHAVAAGMAEPDPRLDVEGWDSAAKILILSQLLMKGSASLEEVARIGIGPAVEPLVEHARRTGGRVRLVARARTWQGRLRLSVAPKVVAPDSPFHAVAGTSKAAVFRTAEGEIVARGSSGRDAIAEVIVQDILEIERRRRHA